MNATTDLSILSARTRVARLRPFAAALMLVTTAACGGDGGGATGPTTNVQPGSFAASIKGAISTDLSGPAVFNTAASGAQLGMGTTDGKKTIAFTRLVAGVPAVGSYTLGADLETSTDFVATYVAVDGSTGALFVSRAGSGTLTITSSSGGHLKGSFSWTGYDSDEPDARTITVTGSFDAPVGGVAASIR